METKTWSVRINDETQGLLETMVSASGLGKKEFFELIINSYDKLIPSEHPELSSDVQELISITSRMNRIYSDMVRRMSSHKKECESELIEQNNLLLNELQEVKIAFEKSNLKLEKLSDENYKLKESISHLETQHESLSQQLDCSHNLFLDYKLKYDECLLNQENISMIEEKANEIEQELKESLRTNEILESEIENLKLQQSEKINHIKDTSDIEKARIVLDLETKCYRALKDCQEEYATKTKELLALIQSSQQPSNKRATK